LPCVVVDQQAAHAFDTRAVRSSSAPGGGIDGFTEVIGLRRFAIFLFDCGAPVGFRPPFGTDRFTAIISPLAAPMRKGDDG
jgi:hypothetical protein